MRTQPPIHRHGGSMNETMSRSMIDTMSISDMQKYADRFSQDKSSQIINSFNHEHHLDNGKSDISHAYSQNNHSIQGKSGVTARDHHYQDVVNDTTNHNNSGSVNSSMVNTINHNMEQDEKLYKQKMDSDSASGSLIENRAKEKVHGQILGSLNSPLSTSKHDVKKLTETALDQSE